jgi:serine/threonine protein kinase
VYDIGEVEGVPYISMEYVDGENLATSLRRIGRFPEDKAADIARQLCAGLAAAHQRGVIHRDLKPANVMLDGAGRVRIMDFGLAAAGRIDDVRAGTPAYMAPEQLLGREVTQRSDIFALGLVIYELFTGRRAYTATTIGDLVNQHESLSMPRSITSSCGVSIPIPIGGLPQRSPLRPRCQAVIRSPRCWRLARRPHLNWWRRPAKGQVSAVSQRGRCSGPLLRVCVRCWR